MTAGPRAPIPVARLGVDLAVRVLPRRSDRRRYQAEFAAELYDMTPAMQLRYTAGVMSRAFALRAALGDQFRAKEDGMKTEEPFWRTFRCRVMRWHHWHTVSNPDGERYSACSVCNKELPAPSHWEAGGVGGGFGIM
jgi:hypothetical protein